MKNGYEALNGDVSVRLDEIDHKIIAELVVDGRLPLAELGRRLSLSPPATAERVRRLEQSGVITGYRAEINPRALGYPLTAIVRVSPTAGQLRKIAELAENIPQVSECHRITGEDCFYIKLHLRSIEELPTVLDRFLRYGQTTTSIINGSPIPHRQPPPAREPALTPARPSPSKQ